MVYGKVGNKTRMYIHSAKKQKYIVKKSNCVHSYITTWTI